MFVEWFPNAVPIVDFFHASEYLWAEVGARYGLGTDLVHRWATRLCWLLKKALAALRGADGCECDKVVGHIAERRDRVRYDEHLVAGLPIGSGRVGRVGKTVVGRRLQCTGMRWAMAGALRRHKPSFLLPHPACEREA